MNDLLQVATTWYALPCGALIFALTFGFLPGFLLRLTVLVYPKNDPRRRDLVTKLYTLGYVRRYLFVGEQLETALFEGVPDRVRAALHAGRHFANTVAVTVVVWAEVRKWRDDQHFPYYV